MPGSISRGQCLLSVGCGGDGEPVVFEISGDRPDQAGLVIHDQRAQGRAGRGYGL